MARAWIASCVGPSSYNIAAWTSGAGDRIASPGTVAGLAQTRCRSGVIGPSAALAKYAGPGHARLCAFGTGNAAHRRSGRSRDLSGCFFWLTVGGHQIVFYLSGCIGLLDLRVHAPMRWCSRFEEAARQTDRPSAVAPVFQVSRISRRSNCSREALEPFGPPRQKPETRR